MRILITVGHSILKGGRCTSADGRKMGGCLEYNWCKAFSRQARDELKRQGHKVDIAVCPERKFTSSSQERGYKLGIANSGKYDLVMELHLNASDRKEANGTEVLYKSAAGRRYAEAVEGQLATVFKSRGAKKTDSLYILNQTRPVAILIEAFFCTNKGDYKKAKGLANRKRLARLVAKGVGAVK